MDEILNETPGIEEYIIKDNKKQTHEKLSTFLAKKLLTKELYDQLVIELRDSPDIEKTYKHFISKLEENEKPPYLIIDELFPEIHFKNKYEQSDEVKKGEFTYHSLCLLHSGVCALFELHKWLVNYKAGHEGKDNNAFARNYNILFNEICRIILEYSPDGVPEVSQQEKNRDFIGRKAIKEQFAKRFFINSWTGILNFLKRNNFTLRHTPRGKKPRPVISEEELIKLNK